MSYHGAEADCTVTNYCGVQLTGEYVQDVEGALDEYFAQQHQAQGQPKRGKLTILALVTPRFPIGYCFGFKFVAIPLDSTHTVLLALIAAMARMMNRAAKTSVKIWDRFRPYLWREYLAIIQFFLENPFLNTV